jgi:uncharacterized protein YbaR (Trm112 family)
MEIMENGIDMPISQELLEILVCPVCMTKVMPTPDDAGLKCPTCCRVYPVREGIPVMLSEAATSGSASK